MKMQGHDLSTVVDNHSALSILNGTVVKVCYHGRILTTSNTSSPLERCAIGRLLPRNTHNIYIALYHMRHPSVILQLLRWQVLPNLSMLNEISFYHPHR